MRNAYLKRVLGKNKFLLEKNVYGGMCSIHDCVNMFALNLYFCLPTQVTSMHYNCKSKSCKSKSYITTKA